MYSSIDFGRDLKELLSQTNDILEIASWAYNDIYLEQCKNLNPKAKNYIMATGYMEMGSEFEYTIDELHEIADKLIAGEEIELPYKK